MCSVQAHDLEQGRKASELYGRQLHGHAHLLAKEFDRIHSSAAAHIETLQSNQRNDHDRVLIDELRDIRVGLDETQRK
jgi:hypothetical protein